MTLKLKISATAFNKLSDEMKAEYKKDEDSDSYTLDVSGLDDTGELKRARDREKAKGEEWKQKLTEAEDKIAELESNGGKKDKDVATLEKTWQKKVEDEKKAGEAKLSKRDAFIKDKLVDSQANALAAKISTSPSIMARFLKDRMTVDFEGDEPTLKILGKDGKASDMTLEQLEQETLANKEFSGILIGSKASGSGAGKDGFNKNGGGAGSTKPNAEVPLAKQTPAELVAHIQAKKEAAGQNQ